MNLPADMRIECALAGAAAAVRLPWGDLMRGKDRQPGGELFSLHWENFPKHEKKSHFAGI
jgi:hypothetical protein